MIPTGEVHLLVERIVRKAPGTTSEMRGKLLKLLERGDQRTYYKWQQTPHERGTCTPAQLATRWSGFLSPPMADKRQRANEAREALGKLITPWTFGIPLANDNPTQGNPSSTRECKQRNKRRMRTQRSSSEKDRNMDTPSTPLRRNTETEITWD